MKDYPIYTTECIHDLKELTDSSARRFSGKDAFRFLTDRTASASVTYGQFGDDVCALANALIDIGAQGRRIALVGENSYEWVLSYFAVVNINATIVPLDKELSKEEMLSLLQRSGASFFIHSKTYEDEAKSVCAALPGLAAVPMADDGTDMCLPALLSRGREMLASGTDRYSDIVIDRRRTCTILFTSGTTGQSKGVMLTHTAIAADTLAASEFVLYTEDDVLVSILPVHHSYEAVAGIFSSLLRGSAIAMCPGIKQLPAYLKTFRPTIMVLVPLYLETFISRIFDTAKKQGKYKKLKFGIAVGNILAAVGINVRRRLLHDVHAFFGGRLVTIIAGGAYLNPALVGKFRSLGIAVLQGYGTTECSPIIAVNRNRYYKDEAVGPVLPCCEVRIDESGVILVHGDNVMTGYLDDPEATAEVLEDGWYNTGDLGYLDDDGFLYVTGRLGDLIVLKNGKNVMPAEIEEKLCTSPLITEAVVRAGEVDAGGVISLEALIYVEPVEGNDMPDLQKAVAQEVDSVNRRLVFYKRIKSFKLRSTPFPKTSTKKIMRYKV